MRQPNMRVLTLHGTGTVLGLVRMRDGSIQINVRLDCVPGFIPLQNGERATVVHMCFPEFTPDGRRLVAPLVYEDPANILDVLLDPCFMRRAKFGAALNRVPSTVPTPKPRLSSGQLRQHEIQAVIDAA